VLITTASVKSASEQTECLEVLLCGVNYIDTSSIYGGPQRWSEQYVGQVMKTRRNETFLATKTKERTRDGSMRMIERSLQLLNTDHVDLWQLHDIGLPEDVDAIFAKGGAMEALLEIEREMGRERILPKGPRLIDIDILLYGSDIVRGPGLEIPHPRMAERKFVLVPLAEIAGEANHPVAMMTIAEMLEATADKSEVRKWPGGNTTNARQAF